MADENDRRSTGASARRTHFASFCDDVRQLTFPREFRIPDPGAPIRVTVPTGDAPQPAASGAPTVETARSAPAGAVARVDAGALADVASCLWYLKTKCFRRAWESADTGDDDARIRRALGRLNKGIDALGELGIEVRDPTGDHYPAGSEHWMKPIQLQPTAGLTFEQVTETVAPIVYWHDDLVQRGEVFVAVPLADGGASGGEPPPDESPSGTSED